MVFPYENEYVKVFLDKSGQIAVLQWKRAVDLEEFKVGYSKLAQLVDYSQVKRWLIDAFHNANISKEAEKWLMYDYFNLFPKLLTQRQLIALVMNEEYYGMIIQDYSLARMREIPEQLSANFFTEYEEALQWLKEEPLPQYKS